MENQQDIDKRFEEIMKSKNVKVERPPAKFPELRYLWGVALIVSFVLIVVASTVQTLIGA
jgi:hypothetical protein